MHTINIRNVDDSIYEKIKHESKTKGLSVNKLLLQILDKFFHKNKKQLYEFLARDRVFELSISSETAEFYAFILKQLKEQGTLFSSNKGRL